MKLDALIAEVLDQDFATFSLRHPEPALLFPTSFGLDLSISRVDTPSGGMKVQGDKTTTAFAVREGPRKKPKGEEKPSPMVFFLAKTPRNPFANMITVGRTSNNDVCLPLSSVSKLHAYFTQQPTGWTLSDGNATNGTFIADKRLSSGASSPLGDGVTLGFGPETIATFYLPRGLYEFLRRSPRP